MQDSDPFARLKAPRNQLRRRLPKLESECKAGVIPQSKGQAGELLQSAGRWLRQAARAQPSLPLFTESRLETCDPEATRDSA